MSTKLPRVLPVNTSALGKSARRHSLAACSAKGAQEQQILGQCAFLVSNPAFCGQPTWLVVQQNGCLLSHCARLLGVSLFWSAQSNLPSSLLSHHLLGLQLLFSRHWLLPWGLLARWCVSLFGNPGELLPSQFASMFTELPLRSAMFCRRAGGGGNNEATLGPRRAARTPPPHLRRRERHLRTPGGANATSAHSAARTPPSHLRTLWGRRRRGP